MKSNFKKPNTLTEVMLSKVVRIVAKGKTIEDSPKSIKSDFMRKNNLEDDRIFFVKIFKLMKEGNVKIKN